jgi:hypothetical protein
MVHNEGDDIALMMEAVSTSDTSVNFYETTRRNILDDSHLHTGSNENRKCLLKPRLKFENFRLIKAY